MTINDKYFQACETPSDINEHLPKLKEYASQCESIIEMGTRGVVSTWAFLSAKPKDLICIDLVKHDNVSEAQTLAGREGVDFLFIEGDVLKQDIPECDFLFIDTFHTASQLEKELELHADKVKKFIGFHDTTTFWENGEQPESDLVASNQTNCGRGLRYALEPFLESHPEWIIDYRTDANNGLTIIKRV